MINIIGDGGDTSNTMDTGCMRYGGKVQTLRRILFRVTSMTLMLVEDRDRQYVWIRKLFTNESTEENEQILEFAIRFMSLTALTMSALSSRL